MVESQWEKNDREWAKINTKFTCQNREISIKIPRLGNDVISGSVRTAYHPQWSNSWCVFLRCVPERRPAERESSVASFDAQYFLPLVGEARYISRIYSISLSHNNPQEWCQNNLVEFWAKGIWSGNSPDLNPIENLLSIEKNTLKWWLQPIIRCLKINIELALSKISSEILDN